MSISNYKHPEENAFEHEMRFFDATSAHSLTLRQIPRKIMSQPDS